MVQAVRDQTEHDTRELSAALVAANEARERERLQAYMDYNANLNSPLGQIRGHGDDRQGLPRERRFEPPREIARYAQDRVNVVHTQHERDPVVGEYVRQGGVIGTSAEASVAGRHARREAARAEHLAAGIRRESRRRERVMNYIGRNEASRQPRRNL